MKPKIRRKDYESKSDYLDALLAYYWWQTLLIFSVVTALMTLLASLIVARAYIIFTLLYTLFCVMFIVDIICEKKQNGYKCVSTPFTTLCFFSIAIIIIFISFLFQI